MSSSGRRRWRRVTDMLVDTQLTLRENPRPVPVRHRRLHSLVTRTRTPTADTKSSVCPDVGQVTVDSVTPCGHRLHDLCLEVFGRLGLGHLRCQGSLQPLHCAIGAQRPTVRRAQSGRPLWKRAGVYQAYRPAGSARSASRWSSGIPVDSIRRNSVIIRVRWRRIAL
eukprot:SAG25_NODE_2236_length_1809_cov_2.170175_4_plen_167_part_00